MRLGFHASHEQIAPSRLLTDVEHAERAGFEMAMCSDHFSPWGTRQESHDLAWHRDRIAELAAVGFDDVYLHFVGQEQTCFPH